MTHGTILVKGEGLDQEWWLHAYHDGHTWEAIRMLILLPWRILECAKNPIFRMWFYDQYVRRERNRSYADVRREYENMIPLQTSNLTISNWIVWQQFSHWNIIERRSLPYLQDPDVIVDVKGDRNVSYKISVHEERKAEIKDDDPQWWEDNTGELKTLVEKKNAELNIAQAKITLDNGVIVPFDEIMMNLLWKACKESSDG